MKMRNLWGALAVIGAGYAIKKLSNADTRAAVMDRFKGVTDKLKQQATSVGILPNGASQSSPPVADASQRRFY